VTSIAAAIALSEALDQTGGKVVVLGTPAEEGGLRGKGGPNGNVKARFVEHGFLKDIDAAMMVHPGGKTQLTGPFLANNHLYFHFYGKPSHAGSSPHKGVNALDALVLLYNGISVLRQQLPDGVRVHGIITNGGQAPNVIPEYASAHYYIRAESGCAARFSISRSRPNGRVTSSTIFPGFADMIRIRSARNSASSTS